MSIPHLPECLLLLGLAAWSLSAGAAPNADTAQRERIARQRAAAERDAQAAEKACAQQFAVTDCVDRVKAERRQRLQPLDRELATLDDGLRKRRAAERLAQIQQRQAARVEARPEVSVRSRKPAASEAQAAAASAPPLRAEPASVALRQAAASQAAADAARRAAASAQRAERAQAHRAAVELRNRERAKQSDPAQPLPPIPAASR